MEPKEAVYECLKNADAPLKSGEIVEKTGIDKKEVDKAIKALKKEEKVVSPKNCFYTVA